MRQEALGVWLTPVNLLFASIITLHQYNASLDMASQSAHQASLSFSYIPLLKTQSYAMKNKRVNSFSKLASSFYTPLVKGYFSLPSLISLTLGELQNKITSRISPSDSLTGHISSHVRGRGAHLILLTYVSPLCANQ